ncbi:hypothetical protein QBC36DRAFT_293063 [Triangularia setosa]|uniref:Uncharacterized protein n=1 Tax=Triangularia setosa TaxID=2587417 RepID=A0AAN6W1P2_9PEZI|nr:hypothetical protein QBC36DRAFT_293063 [Podospora setosa]
MTFQRSRSWSFTSSAIASLCSLKTTGPTSPNFVNSTFTLSKQGSGNAYNADCHNQEGYQYDSEDEDQDDYDTSTGSHKDSEYSPWARTCLIDYEFHLNVYPMLPLLVLTVVEGDYYYIDDRLELNGTYTNNDQLLDELRATEQATFRQSQAQQFDNGRTSQTTSEECLTKVITDVPSTCTPDIIQAGDGFPNDDSENDYDGQSDSDSYSMHYTTWTGLEFTPWATHSYIDPDGRMDLYSLCQVREADLYAHGALPRCDWWRWDDPDQHPPCEGPCLVLSTPEGDEFELDDPKEYDGSYGNTNQASESCRETDDDADMESETGYAFDAAKGIMWADDEAEDDYWERMEGQGEEWWG